MAGVVIFLDSITLIVVQKDRMKNECCYTMTRLWQKMALQVESLIDVSQLCRSVRVEK